MAPQARRRAHREQPAGDNLKSALKVPSPRLHIRARDRRLSVSIEEAKAAAGLDKEAVLTVPTPPRGCPLCYR